MDRIKNEILQSISTKNSILRDDKLLSKISTASELCKKSLAIGGRILFAGNGGSAADSQHLAAELISKYKDDSQPLSGIALTTDSSVLTAIGNDYGFENTFSRQIEAIGRKNDVFIGISTSGKSSNILRAFEKAKGKGLNTIALTGINGCDMPYSNYIDITINAPSEITARIQECHILIGHIICGIIEEEYKI